jgi:exosome complex component CSL4
MIVTTGSDVICKVDRVYPTKAEVTILALTGGDPLPNPLRGCVRAPDCRGFDIDKASPPDHFCPGDVIRASVVSVGDSRSTFLSTVGPDYGVVLARDPTALHESQFLIPVDQSHMKGAAGAVYSRKVAKPVWMKTILD